MARTFHNGRAMRPQFEGEQQRSEKKVITHYCGNWNNLNRLCIFMNIQSPKYDNCIYVRKCFCV